MTVVAAASVAAASAAASSAASASASAAEVTAAAAAGESTAPRACGEEGRAPISQEIASAGKARVGSISKGAGEGSISQGCFAWLPDPRLLHASLDAAISAHGDAYVQVR